MEHPLLPAHTERSGKTAAVVGWLVCAAMLGVLLALLPPGLPRPKPSPTILTLGVIGTWRWTWGALHLCRSLIYKRLVFPRIRRRADLAAKPPAVYVLVTSYRMAPTLNAAIYGRLFDELAGFAVPAVIVACVTDQADAAIIEGRFARRTFVGGTRLEIIAQRGRGKRDAMAEALSLIATLDPVPGSQVVLMDGDTLLSEGSLARSCAILTSAPRVGAITTDNVPLVSGSAFTREWYRVRMAHRDSLMASMSLSRKLLVLTGRFSVFRADIAATNSFINAVRADFVDHGRLGRIRMVTGDDKSTWFETLRHGWDMLYVPDVVVHPVEELPAGGFLPASTALMARWYGNMVRNNGRALGLGPGRCGWFPWLCLADQRFSMWTSLIGPSTALILAMTRNVSFLIAYLIWVLVSRAVVCVLYWGATGRFHPLFIVTLYYNQVVGAAIKIYAFYHPDRQRWTRQTVATRKTRQGFSASLSTPFMAATIGLFVLVAGVLAGTLDVGQRMVRPSGLTAALFSPLRPAHVVRGPGQ